MDLPVPPAAAPRARRLRRWRRLPLVSRRRWLRRVAFWAGAVLVSLVAVAFAGLADRAAALFARALGPLPELALLLTPAGFALAVLLTRRVFPGAQGSGIPQVIAALHMSDPALVARVLSLRVAAGKILLTLLGLACGASIGREGPTVQIGATVMRALGARLHLPGRQAQRALVLAGGAAGVAAAFNTPLAGVVFAIEELSHSFEARTSGTVFAAVIVAGIASLALVGNYAYFGSSGAGIDLGGGWLAVGACGVAGGVAGGAFAATLVRAARGLPGAVGRWLGARPVLSAALCGLGVALLGLATHGATFGTGYAQARGLVEGHATLPLGFPLAKLAATVLSYFSGMPGGIFAPSLAIGAGLGHAVGALFPGPAEAAVLLGMAGYFSGAVQAPITATVIVLEMTRSEQLTLPLMATSLLAFAVSRLICRRPLYGALARGFLVETERAAGKAHG